MRPSDVLFQAQEGFGEMARNFLYWCRIRQRPKPDPGTRMDGQTVIVTGANRSLGKALTEILASLGARVVMACRDLRLAHQAANDIRTRVPGADLVCYHVDLASFQSVRSFASLIKQQEKRIDVLINNAGVFTYKRALTEEGFDLSIGVNFLSPVLLSLLLWERMRTTSTDPRIVFVSSISHTLMDHIKWPVISQKEQFSVSCPIRRGWRSYGHSKLAVLLFVRRFAKEANIRGIRVYATDPGICPTDIITKDMPYPMGLCLRALYPTPIMSSVEEGANSILMSVLSPADGYKAHEYYFSDGRLRPMSTTAQSDETADRLWNLTTHVLRPYTD